MKRLLALLLAAVFILGGLASCSDTTVDSDVSVTDAPATNAPATEPPMTATEPPVTEDTAELNGDPDGEYVYDRVVVICVSGAGTFLKKADTPNIDSIFDGGVVTYKMKAEVPTYTPQNIGSMLHGVTEDLHRITDRVIDSYTYFPESDYPSVFRVAREAYPDMNLSVFSTYAEIGKGIIENDLGVHIDTAETDAELTNKIIRHIQVRDPQLLFVQYNEVDAEGPVSGYGGKEYLDKIAETDGYIGRIYEALREEGMLEDTLFIVTTDHGGHGKYCGHDTNMEIGATFAVVGETVDPECKIKSMEIRDVASVIAYALGLDQPDGWTAKLPDGLFAGAEAMERPTGEIEKEPVEPADLNTADLYADDGSDIYDRVVIIGVDGAGAFFKDAETPNLDAIFADGAVTYTMKTATPSISAQSWGSLLHGVTADLHGLTNSIIPYIPYNDDSIYPSLFKPVRKQVQCPAAMCLPLL